MSKLEVDAEIKSEMEQNPLLEAEKKRDEVDWEAYLKNMDKSTYVDKSDLNYYNSDNEYNFENIVTYDCNLYDHLKEQLKYINVSQEEQKICNYIINNIDEDGYLRVSDEEMITLLKITKPLYNKCLYHVHKFDPVGIGARDLTECLLLQLEDKNIRNETIEGIIKEDLKLLANNKIKEIAKKYNLDIEECKACIAIIRSLDPKPGSSICNSESVYVQPDVVIEKKDGEYTVINNNADMYKLSINKFYRSILHNSEDNEAKEYIKDKLTSAASLIKGVSGRNSTIMCIAEEIIKEQKEFLDKGEKYMKPLRMKDLAEKLDFHESTISRGVNGKYMLTPNGLYEFKYFFSLAVGDENKEGQSAISIKSVIKEIIENEDKKKPLSDGKIVKILDSKNISIARRTVAKYREELGIQASSKRKEF